MKPPNLEKVKRTIVIGSGKGGVGKSTIAWHVAHALKNTGLRIGLLDADVYGPSLPRFVEKYPDPDVIDRQIIPILHQELVCMSMGFLMPQDQAAVWRGPMLMTAVKQMLCDVKWDVNGPLDCLVIDLPPGTGDVMLTLSQKTQIDGALVITTSHPLAVDDAIRAEAMFERLGIPVMGVVENMSGIVCSQCGHENTIFEKNNHCLKSPVIGTMPFLPPYSTTNRWQELLTPMVQHIMATLW